MDFLFLPGRTPDIPSSVPPGPWDVLRAGMQDVIWSMVDTGTGMLGELYDG